MDYDRLFDRPIAFHRAFVSLGGVKVALFLSQAIYWTNRVAQDREGWFYKTREDWEEETGLTREEQETVRRRLKSLGILEEKLEGVPARLWYKINTDKAVELTQASWRGSLHPVGGKASTLVAGKPPTITETTAETTAETTPSSCSDPSPSGPVEAVPEDLRPLELYAHDQKLCQSWPRLIQSWVSAFPRGREWILSEVRKAHAWEIANPTRRKKDRGKFLLGWLNRAQDRPIQSNPTPPPPPTNPNAELDKKYPYTRAPGETEEQLQQRLQARWKLD